MGDNSPSVNIRGVMLQSNEALALFCGLHYFQGIVVLELCAL